MSRVIRQVDHVDDSTIVRLTGEIDLHRSPGFHEDLLEVCAQTSSKLIVDMADVNYIDSSGVGTLVDIFRRLHRDKRKMILMSPSVRVCGVLEITKLDRFFTITATEQEARRA